MVEIEQFVVKPTGEEDNLFAGVFFRVLVSGYRYDTEGAYASAGKVFFEIGSHFFLVPKC